MAPPTTKALDYHKDEQPAQTVQRIKKILTDIGIETSEGNMFRFEDQLYSLRVTWKCLDGSSPTVGSNGKGISPDLARASAYAELLERLQNSNGLVRCGNLQPYFGLMSEKLEKPLDATKQKWSILEKKIPRITQALFKLNPNHPSPSDKVWTVPFYHLASGTLVDLPIEIITRITGSNGMCAGNTPEEALVQGLCEVFERFCMQQVFYKNLVLPTIPKEVYATLKCQERIDLIEKKGLRVIVKDASLGGKYPVVVTLFVDPLTNCYGVKFGSDPILDIAIQRTLTEALQGSSLAEYRDRMLPMLWTQSKASRENKLRIQDQPVFSCKKFSLDGDAQYVDSIFYSESKDKFCLDAFSDSSSHVQMLHEMVNIVFHNEYDIYIRDNSLLGFPTYFCYLPEMSEVFNNEWPDFWAADTLLRLPLLSNEEIKKFCRRIERENQHEIAGRVEVINWFGKIITKKDADIQQIRFRDLLLAQLFLFTDEPSAAYEALQRHLEEIEKDSGMEIESADYFYAALACLKLKVENKSDPTIRMTLEDIYGKELCAEIMEDVLGRKERFGHFKFPICGDCIKCPIKADCYFPQWNSLRQKLNQVILQNTIDQSRIGDIFKSAEIDP